ncbi:MAG: ABC transporter permease, partial [Flavobacteriales bacterium]|nr:ABC transporter permease [Flavobacteriales bacterium]
PGLLNQFKVFVTRDVLAKLTNRQYMLINLLEAPALAALLAFFLKYFTYVAGPESGNSYIFRLNENIPQFIFISVIVALFIGLTVSSEEIIKDKRIRNRESFLNLSRSSYISSKIAIMLGISAIQMILYVLVGAFVLEIKGMALFYWIGLFSTCSFANLLGLNVSANFNSAKVIYILIPVMIIPQLLFSGIIVSFDKLHPAFASEKGVPWIGNIMTSRWAYEGLAVAQFKHNDYGKEFYHLDQRRYFSNWKKDIWINALSNKVASIRRNLANDSESEKVAYDLSILHLELTKETDLINGLEFDYLDRLNLVDCNEAVLDETEKFLKLLIKHYRTVFNKADLEKENKIESMQSFADSEGADTGYRTLLDDYANESLEKFVTNKNGLKSVVEFEGEMVQKKDVIYSLADRKGLLHSNFYSPIKMVFNKPMDTFWANIIVIWSMTILLAITLYTDVFSVFRRWYENMKYRS